MKKRLALALALVLAFSAGSSAPAASALDLGPIRDNPALFTITESTTLPNVAYIETVMSTRERSFIHVHEASRLYSSTRFDILLLDYGISSAYPLLRLWINYCSDLGYLDISSVDIAFGGKKYTFSDVAVDGGKVNDSDGYMERVLIKFGTRDLDFVLALLEPFREEGKKATDVAKSLTATMTLHGAKEDVTVELGYGFFIDFVLMTTAFTSINGTEYIDQVKSTPMTVTNVR